MLVNKSKDGSKAGRAVVGIVAAAVLSGGGVVLQGTVVSAATAQCKVTDQGTASSYGSLQAAVSAAAPGATLVVRGTCTGTTTINQDVTVVGQTATGYGIPTLNGGALGSVVTINSGKVNLESLTITNGNAASDTCGGCGGGVANFGGTANITGVTLTGNVAVATGAGAYNQSVMTLTDSHVVANAAPDGAGLSNGGFSGTGTMVLNGTTVVSGNQASDIGGGLLDGSEPSASVVFSGNTRVEGNYAANYGGGLASFGGPLTLNGGSSVTHNQAVAYGGGGVFSYYAPVVMNEHSTISYNTTPQYGGGLYISGGMLALAPHSTVHNNSAGADGGGIYDGPNLVSGATSRNVYKNTPDDCPYYCT